MKEPPGDLLGAFLRDRFPNSSPGPADFETLRWSPGTNILTTCPNDYDGQSSLGPTGLDQLFLGQMEE